MRLICKYIVIVLLLNSCNTLKKQKSPQDIISNNIVLDGDAFFWQHKDYLLNKIPGISLDKWYSEKKSIPKKNKIVVAVIDSQIDIQHIDLKENIWINKKEIPNNNIDDDNNGYIDDINGWSFLGTKTGGFIIWSNFEYVRIVRELDPLFKDKAEEQVEEKKLNDFKEYKKAFSVLTKQKKFYENWAKSLKYNLDLYSKAKDTLKTYFPKENYTYSQLDSMYKIYKKNDKDYSQRRNDNDKDFGALIYNMMVNLKSNIKSIETIKDQYAQMDSILNKNLNINYNEREYIDNKSQILEKGYGNNRNSNYRRFQDHNTKVSGIIAGNRENNIGIKGFSDNILIMPLNISPSGDEHDKDIAMAIRYAVDNGAKVINMSFGKQFSLHKEWVDDAFKYAELNNVLIVHSSGNSALNIDENLAYPNDTNNLKQVSNNFINVGSINKKVDSTFVSKSSNYGKKNVDLFAPGEEIYTTIPDNKYDYDSGTSLAAPMVSGTAALIWLYYPKLTAAQVKQIILDSGTPYDIEVLIPGGQGKKAKFSELSKSGKVLNVYNAMKMAEAMSKKNKN